MASEQWYSNKELFEQILSMKDDIQSLRIEMKETRDVIRRYNGLREELGELKRQFAMFQAESTGKESFGKSIRDWGGWIFALVTLVVLLLNQF